MAATIGNEGCGVRLLAGKALGVVHAVLLLGHDVAVVGVVVQQELHVLGVALTIREGFQHVDAVAVDVAAVGEGIEIGGIGALPRQGHGVGIILIAQPGIGSQGGGIGDVERQAPHRKPGDRRRGEKGQHAQRLRQAHLNGPGGGAWENEILQMGQHGIQRRDNGGVGEKPGILGHKTSS